MAPKKQKISNFVELVYDSFSGKSLAQFYEDILAKALKTDPLATPENIFITIDYDYYDGDGEIDFHASVNRLETDEEAERRVKQQAAAKKKAREEQKRLKEKQEEAERLMYERLKKKFEKSKPKEK